MAAHTNEFDISIIVPVYKVEEYLIDCLDSISNQTKDNIQVIIIDDGSPDNSGKIADEYCKTHKNFECHHIENGGLGHARNYAFQFVKGKYIAYIDSDDIIESNAYEVMFNAAERNNADITSCNVMRINSSGVYSSLIHANAFNTIKDEVTHISNDLSLIYDITAWNKLIRTDFMRENNFKFGEDMLYEDIPATIPMHCMAKKVAIVKTVTYLWRSREGSNLSITQTTTDSKNLIDRIKSITLVNDFFDKHNIAPSIREAKFIKDLDNDLMIFVNKCHLLPDDLAYKTMKHVRAYIEQFIDISIFSRINFLNRQKYEYILKNDLESLRKLLNNQNAFLNAPINEKQGKFYIECSDKFFTINDRDITETVKTFQSNKYIDAFNYTGTEIHLDAHLYISKLNIPTAADQQVEAFLINDLTNNTIPLKIEPRPVPNLTKSKGFVYDSITGKKANYNYDGTGFRIIFNLEELDMPLSNLGSNHILLKYKNRVKSGAVILGNVSDTTKEKLQNTKFLSSNSSFCFGFDISNQLTINISKIANTIMDTSFKTNGLMFTVKKPALSVFLQSGDGEKIELSRLDETHFLLNTTTIPLNTKFIFYAVNEAGNTDILHHSARKNIIKRNKNGIIYISTLRDNIPELIVTPVLSMVGIKKSKPDIFDIETTTFANASTIKNIKQIALGFEDNITRKFFVLAKLCEKYSTNKAIANFKINCKSKELTKNLHQCETNLMLKIVFKNNKSIFVPVYTNWRFNVKTTHNDLSIRFFTQNKNEAAIRVWQSWGIKENSIHKRKALIEKNYKFYRTLPINKRRILFEVFWGSNYSCNPRAIYEYIDKKYPEYECIWALTDPHHPINGHAKRVHRYSLKYFYYLATSKYFINNVNFPDAYIKRNGQIEVHTMHGTPLKTLGLEDLSSTPEQNETLIKRTSRWDYVVVQGEFTAGKIKGCYGVEPQIMRTGYPRTDTMYNVSPERIAKLKKTLNIPEGKKVIFYAPTWRIKNVFDMQLDIENFRKKLGDDYVLLVRIHHLCSKGYTVPADNKVVFDMGKYHSIEDLYLISDILITDYSSAMFDYAILNKPMIFYLYDLEDYATNLRGMYFDIVKEAPGPIVYNNDELVDSIINIDNAMQKCADRVDAFYNTYVNYECANSSQKVAEILLKDRNSFYNKILRRLIRVGRKLKSHIKKSK